MQKSDRKGLTEIFIHDNHAVYIQVYNLIIKKKNPKKYPALKIYTRINSLGSLDVMAEQV